MTEADHVNRLTQQIAKELHELAHESPGRFLQPAPISLLEHLSQLVSLELKSVRIEMAAHATLDVERFSAQKELLAGTIAAQKENVALAFTASENALQRADASHIEFRTQMEEQAAWALHSMEERVTTLRTSYEHTAESLGKEIASLRDARSKEEGGHEQSKWSIGTVIAVIAAVAAWLVAFAQKAAPK
jgi:hypothetical protein